MSSDIHILTFRTISVLANNVLKFKIYDMWSQGHFTNMKLSLLNFSESQKVVTGN